MTDAGAPLMPPNDSDSTHQGGFDLGGQPEAGNAISRAGAKNTAPPVSTISSARMPWSATVSNVFETGRIRKPGF